MAARRAASRTRPAPRRSHRPVSPRTGTGPSRHASDRGSGRRNRGATTVSAISDCGISDAAIRFDQTRRCAGGREQHDRPTGSLGRPAVAGAGQPCRRAQARLRDHAGCGADHGGPADRGSPVRGDLPVGGRRPDRAAGARRPPAPVPDHGGRGPGPGAAIRTDEPCRPGGQAAAEHAQRAGRRMRGIPAARHTPAGAPPLARAVLALYPPAWRARYGDEALAYLEESGAGSGELASLLWRAAPAWAWPPAHLHDPPARMRASLATILMALSALVLGAGCLPLWLLMLRRERRDHSPRATACLLTPVAAPVAGLLALALILGAVGHPGGVG